MSTNPNHEQARNRADQRRNIKDRRLNARAKAAAEQWIDADKVREEADRMDKGAENSMKPGHNEFSRGYAEAMRECAEHLRKLIAPSLPTLADMTLEEREACRWMQAISEPDSGYTDGTVVIVEVQDDRAMLMWEDGSFDTRYHQHITPLPGESKMKWPSLSVSGESEAVSVETEEIDSSPRLKPGDS